MELLDEAHATGRDKEVASVAGDVFIENEAFDDGRPRRRCAESALGHGIPEVFVIDALAGGLHRGEQGAFIVACRRSSDFLKDVDALEVGRFARLHRHDLALALLVFILLVVTGFGGDGDVGGLAIDGEPARFDEDLAFALELVVSDRGDAGRVLELGLRIEGGDETPGHHVVKFLLGLIEIQRDLAGGDDGKVVADLGAVENAAVRTGHEAVFQGLGGMGGEIRDAAARGLRNLLERSGRGRDVVVGQITGVGPRVGEGLVLFVERLGDLQGSAGGESEATVRLALQTREIVELRSDLFDGLFLFLDGGGLALAAFHDGLGLGAVP